MIWNNIKIALRNIRKNKLFAFINIAGLAIGLTIYVFGGLLINYERDHEFNLWFVVVADDDTRLQQVLSEIEIRSGCPLLDLPLEQEYFIDLGFDLKWT